MTPKPVHGEIMMRGNQPRRFILFSLVHRVAEDVKLLFALLRDLIRGNYRQVPVRVLLVLVLALLYILFPFDFLPDYIPGYGQIDDALVALLGLYFLEKDLHIYKQWKQNKVAGSSGKP